MAGSRVTRIEMTAFRGVPRTFTVDLRQGESLLVFGDNATGKSTIADALEWFFTGRIEILAHEGRQGAIRHTAASPSDVTSVTVETDGSLGGLATVGEGPPAAAQEAAEGEVFLLRGRTLTEFVNKTKGDKWGVLAGILGLGAAHQLLQDLQRARNELRASITEAEDAERVEREMVTQLLSEPDETRLLATIQEQSRAAGIEPPASLDVVLSVDWLRRLGEDDATVGSRVRLDAIASTAARLRAPHLDLGAWNESLGSEDELRLNLFTSAQSLVDVGEIVASCPLCGQQVEPEQYQEHVRAALASLRDAAKSSARSRENLRVALDAVRLGFLRREDLRVAASEVGVDLAEIPDSLTPLLESALAQRIPIDTAMVGERLATLDHWDASVQEQMGQLASTGTPAEPSSAVNLALLAERGRRWREAKLHLKCQRRACGLSEMVFRAYQERLNSHLDDVLELITKRVSEIFSQLHPREDFGAVSIERWTAKGVELAVPFHGITHKPPHGVLSESHLNSLAVSLFLAMAETLNQALGFLILDDVVNSFDIEHRGALAQLLASEFRDRQLIVLTHDHLFYERMRRLAPEWQCLELMAWSYDEGLRSSRDRPAAGLIGKARQHLERDDPGEAARTARRALEEVLHEVCEALEAPLPHRKGIANEQREAGELMLGVRRALKEHAREFYGDLKELLLGIDADLQAALNVESHAGKGQASSTEIEDAITRISKFDSCWTCGECGTRIWHVGSPAAGRCRCSFSRFPPVADT